MKKSKACVLCVLLAICLCGCSLGTDNFSSQLSTPSVEVSSVYSDTSSDDNTSVDSSVITSVDDESEYSNESNKNTDSDSESKEEIPVIFEDPNISKCLYLTPLSFEPVSGVITEEICEKVTRIWCKNKNITTLADLSKFPNLRELYINNGDKKLNLKGINKAPNLSSVTLIDCGLEEVDRLADLENLVSLDISTSSSRGINVNDFSSLAALKNLKFLNMSWTTGTAYNAYHLKDASFINELENLEYLNIYGTGITNYSLIPLKKLKYLSISHTSAYDVVKDLCESGAISNMESLKIYSIAHRYDGIRNEGIKKYLSQAVNLKTLDIDAFGNYGSEFEEVTSLEGLGNLKSLESLNLNNSNLNYLPLDAYNELSKLTNLKHLEMTSAPSGAEGKDAYSFLSGMKSLESAKLTTYSGMGIDCFSNLENLKYLTLVGNGILSKDEVDIKGIEKLKSLTRLEYYQIRFKSSAPLDDLDYLKVEELDYFDLYGNHSSYLE